MTTSLAPLETIAPDQLAILREHVARGCTDSQVAYFLTVCATKKLDPFSRQIYAIIRGGKLSIQTGIDGYRAMAHSTGAFAGIDETTWRGEGDDLACSVTVYRIVQGQRCPFPAEATLREFRGASQIWQKLPRVMLEKCAESRALRRAFSETLAGIYTNAELDQDDRDRQADPARPLTMEAPDLVEDVKRKMSRHGITSRTVADMLDRHGAPAGARLSTRIGRMDDEQKAAFAETMAAACQASEHDKDRAAMCEDGQ